MVWFNAREVEPSASFEVLPAGNYKAVIVNTEEKPTKAQTGSYLQLTLEVIEGPHKGSKLTDRLNLNNPNAQAVNIAQRVLSSICHAINVLEPGGPRDLHNKPLMVKVGVKPAEGSYGPSNEVKGYEPCGGGAQVATEALASKAPWKR